jgi:hypothetical protein
MESRAIVLSDKQAGFLADFGGGCETSLVRACNDVSTEDLDAWLDNAAFVEQMYQRIQLAQLKGIRTLADATPLAAQQLTKIAIGKEDETARKACTDILQLSHKLGQAHMGEKSYLEPKIEVTDEQAEKILEIMAGG